MFASDTLAFVSGIAGTLMYGRNLFAIHSKIFEMMFTTNVIPTLLPKIETVTLE